jgi:hypothetical protein
VGKDPLFSLPPVRRAGDPLLIVRGIPAGGRASIRLLVGARLVGRAVVSARRGVPIRLSPRGRRLQERRRRLVVRVDWRDGRRAGGFRYAVDV